jgi:hypothetical protein
MATLVMVLVEDFIPTCVYVKDGSIGGTASNGLNFLMNQLPHLMQTRCGIFFQHDGAPPCFGHPFMAVNQH